MKKQKFYKLLDQIPEIQHNEIGSVLASTENIYPAPFDIIFNAIESNWTMYNQAYYQHGYDGNLYDNLHDLTLHFDYERMHTRKLFKQFKQISKKQNTDFINRIEYDYNNHMQSIIEELKGIIEENSIPELAY